MRPRHTCERNREKRGRVSGEPERSWGELQKARVGRRHGSAPQGTPGSTAAGGQSGGNPCPSCRPGSGSLLGSRLQGLQSQQLGCHPSRPFPTQSSPPAKPFCLPWRPPKPRAETSLCSPAPVRSEHHQLLPEPASFGPSLLPQREENGKTEMPTEELGSAKNGAKLHRAREPGTHTKTEKAGLSRMGKGALSIGKAAQTQNTAPAFPKEQPKEVRGSSTAPLSSQLTAHLECSPPEVASLALDVPPGISPRSPHLCGATASAQLLPTAAPCLSPGTQRAWKQLSVPSTSRG